MARTPTARGIVRSYLAIGAFTTLAQSLIWGVNTLFLLDAGLDIFQVMIVNGAYSAGMLVFEVPTGVVADTVGRRVSYLLSVAIIIASTLLYMWFGIAGMGVWPFVLASVLLGLGFTFYTGAVDAWMVDALHAVGYEGPHRPHLRPLRHGLRRLHADRHHGSAACSASWTSGYRMRSGPSSWCRPSSSASWPCRSRAT